MKDKKSLVLMIIAFAACIGIAAFAYGKLFDKIENPNSISPAIEEKNEQAEETEAVSRIKATDFSVTDINGNTVKLSDFEGKPVIINFWASWCGVCQTEMPDFEKKYNEYGEEIHFMMVNMTDGQRETVETAKESIESIGYTFPIYFDTMLEAYEAYQIYYLPMTLFIDAEGYGVAYATGMLNEDMLQQGIDMIYTP